MDPMVHLIFIFGCILQDKKMKDTYLKSAQKEIFGEEKEEKTFDDSAIEKIAEYAAEAAISQARKGLSKLRLESNMENHFYEKVKALILKKVREA